MIQDINYIALNTGAKMPALGLGTWKAPVGQVGPAVEYAIGEAGYRHIDCAAIYLNEPEIGEAFSRVFASEKVKREEVFVTSKLWNDAHGRTEVAAACKKTLHDLQLDYLDLYLMHWGVATPPDVVNEKSNLRGEPVDENGFLITKKIPIRETWEALEDLVKAGLTRAIGVSNFTGALLVDLLSHAHLPPAVNQIELHPYNQQSRLVDFCHHQGIAVTAYSPLGSPGKRSGQKGYPALLTDNQVVEIAQAHGKSPAQVLIRWAIQRGTAVIPKSITPERIKSNFAVFDFELSEAEMATLGTLERKYRFVDPYKWWKIPYFE